VIGQDAMAPPAAGIASVISKDTVEFGLLVIFYQLKEYRRRHRLILLNIINIFFPNNKPSFFHLLK